MPPDEDEDYDDEVDEQENEESAGVMEPLLYDPGAPSRAVLLDELPGNPRIDENGQIRLDSPAKTLLALIVPSVVIIGHGCYLLSRFFRQG